VFVNKKTIRVPSGLNHSGSSSRQAKLSTLWKKGVMLPVSDEEFSQEEPTASEPGAPHMPTILKVAYDFADVKKAHAGEGRIITVELDSFFLVACYVPNIGEGARRLEYRVNEWYVRCGAVKLASPLLTSSTTLGSHI
jgi:exonuclease III